MIEKVNLAEKLARFDDHGSAKIVADMPCHDILGTCLHSTVAQRRRRGGRDPRRLALGSIARSSATASAGRIESVGT